MCRQEQEKIEEIEQGKIVAETARIEWSSLEFFYARGLAILVSDELDLVKVAHALSQDEAEQISTWIDTGKLHRSFDEQAKLWSDSDADVWSVVVKPWVLVQAVSERSS